MRRVGTQQGSQTNPTVSKPLKTQESETLSVIHEEQNSKNKGEDAGTLL